MSLRKSVIALAMTAAMIFPAGISASSNLIVEVNGEVINAPMSYISEENRTMVPIALISDSLGYEVNWDSNERTATFSGEDVTVVNKIGENFILLNGEKIIMDSPSVIKEGRTMVPLNAISTALGADVIWDAQTRTAIVKEKIKEAVSLKERVNIFSKFASSDIKEFSNLDEMLDNEDVEKILKAFVEKNEPLKVIFIKDNAVETFDNILEADILGKDADIIMLTKDYKTVYAVEMN